MSDMNQICQIIEILPNKTGNSSNGQQLWLDDSLQRPLLKSRWWYIKHHIPSTTLKYLTM